jgi:uncharacterized repeat protein (TIGR03803 family)
MKTPPCRIPVGTRYRKLCARLRLGDVRQAMRAFTVLMAFGVATLAGCGDDGSGGPDIFAIQITATHASIAKGTSTQLTATAVFYDNSHADVTSNMTWTSSNEAVATVSSSGTVSAVGTGNVTISGTCTTPSVCGSFSSSLIVTVTPATLASITLTPPIPSIAAGTSQQFTATGTFSDNTTQNLSADLTWTSSNTSLATVSSTGLASTAGAGTGTATITATCSVASVCSNLSGTATLTVTPATLSSITLSASSSSIAAGATEQFTATGNFSDNATQNLSADVNWTSSNTAVTTVSSSGLVSAVGAGTATITVACKVAGTCGSVSGTSTVTVTQATLASIAVTPASPSIALGLTENFTATGTYSDNSTHNLTGQVTWTSATTSVATISNASGSAGVAHPVATGTTHITAALGAITSPAVTLTVTPAALQSITVTPASPSISASATEQFIATGTYSDQSTPVITSSVTWSSSDTSVASISNALGSQGLATGLAAGTSSITATQGGITSPGVTLTVTAQSGSVLYSFGASPDGKQPWAGLTQGADGNFYGTTSAGGANNKGTVFKLTPAGVETVLYSFGSGTDGSQPVAALLLANDGNFYGTTERGGTNNDGTVFKITPAGVETVLFSFSGNNGQNPGYGKLIQASDGNLYGTTLNGGAYGSGGEVFKLTLAGVETVVHSFGQTGDISFPEVGVIQGADGNLYGTTLMGGTQSSGALYEIALPSGTETVLHSFGTAGDGSSPQGAMVQASNGSFYGVTANGGTNGYGTVYKYTPGVGESVVYSFGATGDGRAPFGGLTLGSDGNLYGTTDTGGAGSGGTFFSLTTSGVETILVSFGAFTGDAITPYGTVIQGTDGHFYGTTYGGGAHSNGTVFKH